MIWGQHLKYTIYIALLSVVTRKLFQPLLLPHGWATKDAERGFYQEVNYNIKNLGTDGRLKKLYERQYPGKAPLLIGSETIVLDDDSNIYGLTKEGKIIVFENITSSMDDGDDGNLMYADAKVLVSYVGRPLGGKFVPGTKTMYIADALLGLCRVDLSRTFPKLELVVSEVKTATGDISPILYADDIDVGKSGMVYFSDASNIPPERDSDLTFDIMHAYKLDYMRGKKTGRLLRYNPDTDETVVLVDHIWFANGVAVDADETFILISETSMYRVLKYHLAGPKTGQHEISVDGFPGHVDGVDCSFTSGICYVAIPTPVIGLSKLLYKLPKNIEAAIKTFFMMLPKWLSPKPISYGGFVELKIAKNDNDKDVIQRIVQDPYGEQISFITGVTEHKGKLYLGSLENQYIGIYQLD